MDMDTPKEKRFSGSTIPARGGCFFEESFHLAHGFAAERAAVVCTKGCAQCLELRARDLCVAEPCVGQRPEGVVGGVGKGADVLDATLDIARIGLSAERLGATR